MTSALTATKSLAFCEGCCQKPVKTLGRDSICGTSSESLVAQGTVPGAHLQSDTWPQVSPSCFEHIHQGKRTCVLHKDKYGISAPSQLSGSVDRTR